MQDEYLKTAASYLRLVEEYKKHSSLVVAFDFDGTVYDFHQKGHTHNQVIQLLKDLKSIGCTLICFTANENEDFVRNFLDTNKIPYDKLNENPDFFQSRSKKIYYNVLLDDRAGLYQVYTELTSLVKYVKDLEKNSTVVPVLEENYF